MTRLLAYADSASWIRQMKGLVDRLEASETCVLVTNKELASEAARFFDKIIYADIGVFNPVFYSSLVSKAVKRCEPSIMAAPCTNKGRIIAGYMASALNALPISDVIDASLNHGEVVAKRLVFGGGAAAVIRSELPAALCLSPGAFPEASPGEREGVLEEIRVEERPEVKVEFKPRESMGVEPDKADVVVVAGRGVKKKEDLEMIKELASLLGGAWSVTRPLAADYGWSDTWIGISGLVISPRLYIAIGVSGQPHHMMGVRGSRIIVAVNKDPNAPIFEEADYGIVGDLYKIVPILIKKIKELRG